MLCMLYWLTFLCNIISFYFILGYFLVKLFELVFGVFIPWVMPLKASASKALCQVNLLIKTSVERLSGT